MENIKLNGFSGVIGHSTDTYLDVIKGNIADNKSSYLLESSKNWIRVIIKIYGKSIHTFSCENCQLVIFNGHISNEHKLTGLLKEKAIDCKGFNNAERIWHLYMEYGESLFSLLDGNYSIVIFDGNTIILGHDRFGIKPLYYSYIENSECIYFATEIKHLLEFEEILPQIDERKLVDVIIPGFPVGNNTFIKGISTLKPAHIHRIQIRDSKFHKVEKQYYKFCPKPVELISLDEAEKRLSELLIDAVSSRTIKGSECGLALSGGLDSTLIALIADRYLGIKLSAFTITSDTENQDLQRARSFAKQTGLDHHQLILSFDEFLHAIPDIVSVIERPPLHVGTPFYLLCHDITKSVNVCLIGEAADIIFGGGKDYLNDRYIKKQMRECLSRAEEQNLEISEDIINIVTRLCEQNNYDNFFNQYFQYKLNLSMILSINHYYSTSNAVGLDIRDPFLDLEILKFMETIPPCYKANRNYVVDKYLFRRTCLRMFGSSIYDAVLCGKQGFGSSFNLYRKKYEELCEAIVSDNYVMSHPYRNYFEGKSQLVLFDLFKHIFIDHRGHPTSHIDIVNFMHDRRSI